MTKDFKLTDFISNEVEVAIDYKMRDLCRKPYYKHPKGCPNFGKKEDCPPKIGLFDKTYRPLVRVVAKNMDFRDYKNLRKKAHPNWSEKQLANPLYWQGMLRARLRQLVKEELEKIKDKNYEIVYNMEAMGVNVTETCRRAGLVLEWPPKNMVYQIALIAKKLIPN